MTNRVLSAQEALDWGLVNRVVPAAELMSEVTKLATQLAKGPTRAYGVFGRCRRRAERRQQAYRLEPE
jgi:2-(1,2-epoxy-1,2-dihydrophenyl)acetyl-CoA isomerase